MEQARKNVVREFFSGRKGKQRIFISLALIWPIIHFLVFWLWINIDAILLTFQNPSRGEWTLDNFKWVFSMFTNPISTFDLGMALKNTMILFCWNTFVEIPIAITLAYVFFKKLPGNKFFTIALYLPSIISATVMVAVYKAFVGTEGPIALLVDGWQYPITNPDTSMISMLAYNLWTGYGLSVILYRSAMNRIPPELFESAALDGVTMWQELTKIILPLIWPTLSTMVLVALSGLFGSSGPILLFVGDFGAAQAGLLTLSHAMYMQYKVVGRVEYAAAIGFCCTVVSVPLVFVSRWLMSKVGGEYEY